MISQRKTGQRYINNLPDYTVSSARIVWSLETEFGDYSNPNSSHPMVTSLRLMMIIIFLISFRCNRRNSHRRFCFRDSAPCHTRGFAAEQVSESSRLSLIAGNFRFESSPRIRRYQGFDTRQVPVCPQLADSCILLWLVLHSGACPNDCRCCRLVDWME